MTGSQSIRLSLTRALAAGVLCLLVLSCLATGAWASYGGLSTSSPVGSPTVPPSSYEGGLVARPNPLDSSSNAVIEGNVRGGKQFRAPIPYNPPTSFHGTLGSTRLDSFLRYSAVPEELGGYAPGYDAFYSPTGTVSTIRPGQAGVFAPTSPRVAGGIGQWRAESPADVVDLGDIRSPRVSPGRTAPASDAIPDSWRKVGTWSLGSTPEQMRLAIPDETERQFADSRTSQPTGQSLSSQEYQQQMEQFRQQLERVRTDASRLEQSLRVDDALPRDVSRQAASDPTADAGSRTTIDSLMRLQPQPQTPTIDRRSDSDLLPKSVPPVPDTSSFEKQVQARDAAGIADIVPPFSSTPGLGQESNVATEPRPPSPIPQSGAVGLGVDAAARTNHIAELMLPRGQATAGQSRPAVFGELPALQRMRETAAVAETSGGLSMYTPTTPAGEIDTGVSADANEPETGVSKPSGSLIGDQISGQYGTLTKSRQERLERYLKVGDAYLREGQYARAAESFSLASLYGPNDRRVHIGRCHALFAAGEYAGSAIYLAKAIEVDPNQTLARMDLVNATGGPDLFLRCVTDLEVRAETNGAPDLQLLLAYIYYVMGEPKEAEMAIEAAERGQPRLPAVELFKAAIHK